MEEKEIDFLRVSGVSAGAIIAPFAALGNVSEHKELFTNIKPADFWRCSPTNKKGKISLRAILRFIQGKPLGDFSNLEWMLRKHFPFEDFDLLNRLGRICYNESVNMKTGSIELGNSVLDTWPIFIRRIVASASIPVFTEAFPRADGGLRNHLPVKSMENHFHDINRLFVLWARPEDLSGVLNSDYKPKNQVEQLERTLAIMNFEISKNDRERVRAWCKKGGVKLHEFFQPVVMNGVYDTDPGNQKRLFEACYQQVISRLK